jgi:hypothetical protein
MPDQDDLDADPRGNRAGNIVKNDPHRGCLRLARLRILCVHNGVYPDVYFAGLYQVSDSRIGHRLRYGDCTGELSESEDCRENDPAHFHDKLQSRRRISRGGSLVHAARRVDQNHVAPAVKRST